MCVVGLVFPRWQLKCLSHIVWFHLNNPNYILNKCIRMMKNQSKHENVIAIWDELRKKAQL
jgi:predicted MarR family transcription regulator